MKVAFVNPPVTRTERYGSLAAAGSYAPPLALCGLAAVTRKLGHDTVILDAQVLEMDRDQAARALADFGADVVGITSTTSTFLSAAALSEKIKAARPHTTVVLGGVHISALPEKSLLENRDIDAGVIGEGEETIAEFLGVLERRQAWENVRGLAFRQGGRVIFTGERPLIQDLDSLPMPAWDLLPNFPGAYNLQAQSVAHFPSTSVFTSRGCTGDCTFCDRRIFGRSLRAHSAEYVMRMIEELYTRYGIRDIQFEDDNFMLFRKRLFQICDAIRERRLDLSWSCQARIDMVKLDTLKKMKEAGCWMILYGVESGSQKVLDAMKKGITIAEIERAIALTHEAGIGCKGFFIAGFLNEDRDTLQESYEFIKRCKLDDISFHYFTPFPGSASYEVAAQYGELRGSFSDMTYYRPVFLPRALTEEDLIRHTKACYRAFYTKPRILLGYLRRIRSWSDLRLLLKSGLALFTFLFVKKE